MKTHIKKELSLKVKTLHLLTEEQTKAIKGGNGDGGGKETERPTTRGGK